MEPGRTYRFWVKAFNGSGRTSGRDDPSTAITTPLPTDFDVMIEPDPLEVFQGGFSIATVRVDFDPDEHQGPSSVSLRLDGLPAVGTDHSFEPGEGTPPFDARLRIEASTNTPAGDYAPRVTATGSDAIGEPEGATKVIELGLAVRASASAETNPPTTTTSNTTEPGGATGSTGDRGDGGGLFDALRWTLGIVAGVIATVIAALILAALARRTGLLKE